MFATLLIMLSPKIRYLSFVTTGGNENSFRKLWSVQLQKILEPPGSVIVLLFVGFLRPPLVDKCLAGSRSCMALVDLQVWIMGSYFGMTTEAMVLVLGDLTVTVNGVGILGRYTWYGAIGLRRWRVILALGCTLIDIRGLIRFVGFGHQFLSIL